MRLVGHQYPFVLIQNSFCKRNRCFRWRFAIIKNTAAAPIRTVWRQPCAIAVDYLAACHARDPGGRLDGGETLLQKTQQIRPFANWQPQIARRYAIDNR